MWNTKTNLSGSWPNRGCSGLAASQMSGTTIGDRIPSGVPLMGPSENPRSALQNQEPPEHRRPLSRRPRARRCLLKGCGRCYHPRRGLQRYCGDYCSVSARAWSLWKARGRYRATTAGKEKRRAQSQRYRERMRKSKKQAFVAAEAAAWVISTHPFEASCDRPGCYESFARSRRSPLQRFCSKTCRRALERVWERERRWQEPRTG